MQTYEPGSVFKIFTLAAALDSGAVTPETEFLDTGVVNIGGMTIYNWDYGAWGYQDMTGCMQHSLNVCLAWVATQLGPTNFYNYLQRFGVGHLTGIDLAGEANPLRLATRQGGCRPAQGEILQAHLDQESEAVLDLAEQLAGHFALAGREIPALQFLEQSPQRQSAVLADGPPLETHRRGIVPQAAPTALAALDLIDQVIQRINANPKPLALYWFDDDRARVEWALKESHAGGMCVNETLMHVAQEDLPFGGVGPSGIGAYHGSEGFRTFSQAKPIYYDNRLSGSALLRPPYGKLFRLVTRLLHR